MRRPSTRATSASATSERNWASISSSIWLAQARLDVGAQLGERVELARGARQLVVERRQHLLLDLLHRDRDGLLRAVRELELDLLRLAGAQADDALLDLLDDGAAAELDDVVAPRLALRRDEVDDRRCRRGRPAGPRPGRARRRSTRSASSSLLDELLRDLGLVRADLELSSSRPPRASPGRRRWR